MAKLYAFELSGEHPTLPRSEALALLEIHSASFEVAHQLERCLVVAADQLDLNMLERRLAMTHRIVEILAICDANYESIETALRSLDLPNRRYRIRARRLGDDKLTGYDVERMVGKALYNMGYRADLENPELDFRAIVSRGKIIFGYEVARPERSGFERRRPHLKPFFYPGVLMPRIARSLVNLTMVQQGEFLLDPFCGTAGILVEAGLMGIRCAGIDVQRKLITGAKLNLVGLDADLIVGDARSLPIRDASIDAIVTDTPYGRSAVIKARSKEEMLLISFKEMYRVLRPGRIAVVVTDRPATQPLRDAGFKISETHTDRVHRSLTRYIQVCEKPANF